MVSFYWFHPPALSHFSAPSRRFCLLIYSSHSPPPPSFVVQFIIALFFFSPSAAYMTRKICSCVVASFHSFFLWALITLKKMSVPSDSPVVVRRRTISTVIGVRSAMTDTFTPAIRLTFTKFSQYIFYRQYRYLTKCVISQLHFMALHVRIYILEGASWYGIYRIVAEI